MLTKTHGTNLVKIYFVVLTINLATNPTMLSKNHVLGLWDHKINLFFLKLKIDFCTIAILVLYTGKVKRFHIVHSLLDYWWLLVI